MSLFSGSSFFAGTGYNGLFNRDTTGGSLFVASEKRLARMRAKGRTGPFYTFLSEQMAKRNRKKGQETEVSTVDDILLTQDKKKRQRGKKTNVTGGISARPTLFQGGLLS